MAFFCKAWRQGPWKEMAKCTQPRMNLTLNEFSWKKWKPPLKQASQMVLVVKNLPANAGDVRETGSIPAWVEKILWRKVWQPTPVFLPGESHGHRSLANYSPQGHRVTTKQLTLAFHHLWDFAVDKWFIFTLDFMPSSPETLLCPAQPWNKAGAHKYE